MITDVLQQRLFGSTFSRFHFDEFQPKLDWKACLDYMTKNLPPEFNFLRVGAYWKEIEAKEGVYDWTKLDEVIDAIDQTGRFGILLSAGMKAPRYPEYYIPDWAIPEQHGTNQEISLDPTLRTRVLNFITQVVNRYKSRSVVKAWQVENEPMDRAGDNKWFIGADFVSEEAAKVRELDGTRPLVINCWCEIQTISSAPWGLDGDYAVRNALVNADVLGLDIYSTVADSEADYQSRCLILPNFYHEAAMALGKGAWVAESQAEPWFTPPGPSNIQWLMDQHLRQGFRSVLLWGLEWWYDRVVNGKDTTIWDHVQWEAKRFGILSRVMPGWSTNSATNIAGLNGKLYMTVVGERQEVWLLTSSDDGLSWTPQQPLGWNTGYPIGITGHTDGKLYLTVVGAAHNHLYVLSSADGQNWTPTQVMGNQGWTTPCGMNIASHNGKLYLTVVGGDANEIWLLSSSDGQNWTPTQVLGDQNWKTLWPIGITSHSDGKLYLSVVGWHNEIWVLSSADGQNWSPTQVLGDQGWQTAQPIGITSHGGKLYLGVVGNDQNQIWLVSSADGQNWSATSGIFAGWETPNAIALTNFQPSDGTQPRLHVSIVGNTDNEIYICTNNPDLSESAVKAAPAKARSAKEVAA